ncbi:putative F-box domain-containing protein [Tanacetum coccineum]
MRLQVSDLIRCKSVCKSWYSLISSPRFAKSQLNYNLKKKVDNSEIGNTRISSLAATRMFFYEEYLVGSSNGLVCISRNATDFLVINPSTREVKQLRNPLGEYNSRSVAVASGYGLWGKGILCNGAIHWYSYDHNDEKVIVPFDLSKEVFKEIPRPKLGRSDWDLETMKDCLCVLASPNINFRKNEDIEIWVMRSYNVQESWERKLPPPGYDTRKPVMRYVLPEDFFNRHVHIWLLEEGSGAPVLVRSIKRRRRELLDDYPHIRLSTYSECNYNYDEHVFVKSLAPWHGSVAVASGYDLYGNGILCNGVINWLSYNHNDEKVIVSFDLSNEVFKEIPQPKLCRSDWELGTMKDCLCIVVRPNIDFRKNEDIEIWVMRSYNVQESWERKLPPPGYDTRKLVMSYVIPEEFFNRHVHIWLLEEGSGAPVLVRSIKRRRCELLDDYPHIHLSTYSECNYNYDKHVFVKSLVSPHGMGDLDRAREDYEFEVGHLTPPWGMSLMMVGWLVMIFENSSILAAGSDTIPVKAMVSDSVFVFSAVADSLVVTPASPSKGTLGSTMN